MSTLTDMYSGTPRPLGPDGEFSSIRRVSAPGPWCITTQGLVGDVPADKRYHGGPDKALHHYAKDHYAAWKAERPDLAERLARAAAFGENISLFGFTEDEVCIGDAFAAGPVRLQVSHGREPCYKLNDAFGVNDMVRDVLKSGRTGWYYRVLEEGEIEPGSDFVLEDRPNPEWTVTRAARLLFSKSPDLGELQELADIPELAEVWAKIARKHASAGIN